EVVTSGGSGADVKIVGQQTDSESVVGQFVTWLLDAIKQTAAECEGTTCEVVFDYRSVDKLVLDRADHPVAMRGLR
ncbi:MAG: hypothetical protein Q9171_006449, partial [Xanthocarpia ochracea]